MPFLFFCHNIFWLIWRACGKSVFHRKSIYFIIIFRCASIFYILSALTPSIYSTNYLKHWIGDAYTKFWHISFIVFVIVDVDIVWLCRGRWMENWYKYWFNAFCEVSFCVWIWCLHMTMCFKYTHNNFHSNAINFWHFDQDVCCWNLFQWRNSFFFCGVELVGRWARVSTSIWEF